MRFITLFLFTSIFITTYGNNTLSKISANEAGYIVHMLNYLSNDYKNAVDNGKVKSEAELKEMIEFAAKINHEIAEINLDSKQKDTLLNYSSQILALVKQHADQIELRKQCEAAKHFLLVKTGLKTYPTLYPSLSNGKIEYAKSCSKCHGKEGKGDGLEGVNLNPKPRNFLDKERMKGLSPFAVFNTIRYGIEGTGMEAHTQLSDTEVWDLACYVLSLRHQSAKAVKPNIPLEEIATKSDDELLLLMPDSSLSGIRMYEEPDSTNNKPLVKANRYLEHAYALCLNGDFKTADKLITIAYLEGIEPYEFELKKSNPDLIPTIEKQIAIIHQAMDNEDASEGIKEIKKLKELLSTVENSLNKTDYKPIFSAFMTLSIVLREGLEALLVIIIFMNILSVTHLEHWKKIVHLGWISAISVGMLLWLLLGEVIKNSKLNMELLEGALTLTAVMLLIYVGFWLHKRSSMEQWKNYIQEKVKTHTGNASLWGIFSLSFLVVFREIFESILFISTVDIQSNGRHRLYILVGCITAFLLIIGIYFIFTHVSKNIPFKKIITFSVFILSILAITLVGKGIHSLQEAGLIGVRLLNFNAIDILGIFPTWQTLFAQVFTCVLLWFLYKRLQNN